jgi:hypothetical protein
LTDSKVSSAANATNESGGEAEIAGGVGCGVEPRREVYGAIAGRLIAEVPRKSTSEHQRVRSSEDEHANGEQPKRDCHSNKHVDRGDAVDLSHYVYSTHLILSYLTNSRFRGCFPGGSTPGTCDHRPHISDAFVIRYNGDEKYERSQGSP